MIEKEIEIVFSAQSKGVVEKVKVRYVGSIDELNEKNVTNDNILQETIQLQRKAEAHSLTGAMRK